MRFNPRINSRSVCSAVSLAALALCVDAHADVVYDSLPVIVDGPTSTGPSYGYEANGYAEIGDHVALSGTSRNLQSVTVQMNDYAIASNYPALAAINPLGYTQALTLNLYTGTNTTTGAAFATETIDVFVPFRPASDPTCGGVVAGTGQTDYRDPSGVCRTSVSFNVTFDFSSMGIVLPDDLVYGLAFNTQNYGTTPTGTAGPYNQLNLTTAPEPTVGTDATGIDGLFFRDASTGGAFTNLAGNDPYGSTGIQIVANATAAVPEPSSIALLGIAGAGLLAARRRRTTR